MSKRGNGSAGKAEAKLPIEVGEGPLWVGRHSGDQDILVLDRETSSFGSANVTLYSLTQHRMRTFPRAIVAEKIHELEEPAARERAISEYSTRNELKAVYDDGLRVAREEQHGRQRDAILSAHKRYLSRIGVRAEGVIETLPDFKPGRRVKCHVCGIALDDFAGFVCVGCEGLLCSCGACACGTPSRRRKAEEVSAPAE